MLSIWVSKIFATHWARKWIICHENGQKLERKKKWKNKKYKQTSHIFFIHNNYLHINRNYVIHYIKKETKIGEKRETKWMEEK